MMSIRSLFYDHIIATYLVHSCLPENVAVFSSITFGSKDTALRYSLYTTSIFLAQNTFLCDRHKGKRYHQPVI